MSAENPSVVERAEAYYDSDDADRFYFHIWGGEDLHIGTYERPDEDIKTASARTVQRMMDRIPEDRSAFIGLDLGAGYGGSARQVARRFDARMVCLNLSQVQNRRNEEVSAREGMEDQVEVIHGNFEELPFEGPAFDLVWSQDAFLHSGRRETIFREIDRVLKPGGELVFTDPMQTEDADPETLRPVLERIHLESLGSVAGYREMARSLGWAEASVDLVPENLAIHYGRVRDELRARRDELRGLVSEAYMDRMDQGLGVWVEAAKRGALTWGILHFRKPA